MDDRNKDGRFPSNAYNTLSAREPIVGKKKEPRKIEPVAKGRLVHRKKSLGEKFAETFLATDMQTIVQHIIYDVLIPTARETLSDIIDGTKNMMLFGDRKGRYDDRGRSRANGRSYTDYYESRRRSKEVDTREPIRPRSRDIVEDIILNSRAEAQDVLDRLLEDLEELPGGAVTVNDAYDYAGIPTDHTKERYGWYNLNSSDIVPVRGGFLLKLPKPVVLD